MKTLLAAMLSLGGCASACGPLVGDIVNTNQGNCRTVAIPQDGVDFDRITDNQGVWTDKATGAILGYSAQEDDIEMVLSSRCLD